MITMTNHEPELPTVLPTIDDIRAAHRRIEPVVHRTPVVTCRSLSEMAGGELLFKCENFQRGGSFKIRGAYNRISSIPPEDRERGIVAYSSGNHAQGAALAAKLCGVKATIFVPEDIPKVKLDAVKGYGAVVEFAGTTSDHRRNAAGDLARDTGAVVVPPFDDPFIISGQGTVGLELVEQVAETGNNIDRVVVPIGGGGLISGISIAVKALRPDVEVIGVEPELACKMKRSLDAGKIEKVIPGNTVADGLKPVSPGVLTFEAARRHVDRVVTVNEKDIVRAAMLLLERAKMVVEPSGAVPLAACISGSVDRSDSGTALVLSGGNVDLPELFRGLPG